MIETQTCIQTQNLECNPADETMLYLYSGDEEEMNKSIALVVHVEARGNMLRRAIPVKLHGSPGDFREHAPVTIIEDRMSLRFDPTRYKDHWLIEPTLEKKEGDQVKVCFSPEWLAAPFELQFVVGTDFKKMPFEVFPNREFDGKLYCQIRLNRNYDCGTVFYHVNRLYLEEK